MEVKKMTYEELDGKVAMLKSEIFALKRKKFRKKFCKKKMR